MLASSLVYCTEGIKTGLPARVFISGVCRWWHIVNSNDERNKEKCSQWSSMKPNVGSPHHYPSTGGLSIEASGDDDDGD